MIDTALTQYNRIMRSDYCVYRFCNAMNGKLYFGKGTKYRIKTHIRSIRQTPRLYDSLLLRALRKYGLDQFEITVMFDDLTENEALQLEIIMIVRYRTNVHREYEPCIFGHGYNQTNGGDGSTGHVHSLETKTLMSKLKLGTVVRASTKQLLSDLNTGKKLSDETKMRMSIARKGQTAHNKGKKTGARPLADIAKITATKRAKSAAKTASLIQHIGTMRMLLVLGSTRKDVQKLFHISQQRLNELLSFWA